MNLKMLILTFAILNGTNIYAQEENLLFDLTKKSLMEIGKDKNLNATIDVNESNCQSVLLKDQETIQLANLVVSENICLLSMEEIFTFDIPVYIKVEGVKIRRKSAVLNLIMVEKATEFVPKISTKYIFKFSCDGVNWILSNSH